MTIHRRGGLRSCMLAGLVAVIASGLGPGRLARAAEGDRPAVRFGVVADVQYRDTKPAGRRHYRASVGKLEACVRDLNTKKLAFTIHLGDFIDRDFANFDAVDAVFKRLTMARYHLLGNHDFAVSPNKRALVPAKLGMPSRYYEFVVNGWRFVVLDSMDVSFLGSAKGGEKHRLAKTIRTKLKKAKAVNAVTWNGAVGAEQMAWLEGRLEEAARHGQRVVLFSHMPVFPANVHNLWNDSEMLALIDRHPCVAAYINGHNHAGHYGERNGVHYLTIQGMVDTPTAPAYAVVEAYADRLQVIGIGREPSRTLKLAPRAAAAKP